MEKLAFNNELKEVVFLEFVVEFKRKHCTRSRDFLLKNDLNYPEQNLPHEKLFKINDSYIIKTDFLKLIKQYNNKCALLHGGDELNIAKGKYSQFNRFLKFKYRI